MILADEFGRIRDVLNSTHPDPKILINTHVQGHIIDGFVRKFQELLALVMAGKGPQEFLCLINLTGPLEARWWRVIKIAGGIMIIADGYKYIIEFDKF